MSKIAICYWGLVRTLQEVLPSQKQYVYDELDNAGFKYDVFFHTWKTNDNLVWNRKMKEPIKYETMDLVNPLKKQIDDQSEFLKTIKLSDYYYEGQREWLPQLILNHLCALESQKRCANLCLESDNKYDYIMFLRPDALIRKRLPVEKIFTTDFSSNRIVIANFNHWEGYNDQFAVLHPEQVRAYSHRIDGIAEFRKTNGRIVSEKYVKYVVDRNYVPTQVDFRFDLLRPNGKLNGNL